MWSCLFLGGWENVGKGVLQGDSICGFARGKALSESTSAGICWKKSFICLLCPIGTWTSSVSSWRQVMMISPVSCFSSFHWVRKVELHCLIFTCCSPVFPLVCLWLLRSCCSGDAGAGRGWVSLCPRLGTSGHWGRSALQNGLGLPEMSPAVGVVCS